MKRLRKSPCQLVAVIAVVAIGIVSLVNYLTMSASDKGNTLSQQSKLAPQKMTEYWEDVSKETQYPKEEIPGMEKQIEDGIKKEQEIDGTAFKHQKDDRIEIEYQSEHKENGSETEHKVDNKTEHQKLVQQKNYDEVDSEVNYQKYDKTEAEYQKDDGTDSEMKHQEDDKTGSNVEHRKDDGTDSEVKHQKDDKTETEYLIQKDEAGQDLEMSPPTTTCPPQDVIMSPFEKYHLSVIPIHKGKERCDDSLSKWIINLQPYFNKEACCKYAQNKSLPELCGEVNETTLGNRSLSSPACSCIDFMACKTVALTGISSDHYDEVQDAIASVQNFHPDMEIFMYDLGLKPCEVEHFNSLHNVKVIEFPFEHFPPYVRHLKNFAWKILGIHAMLQEHEIVFWMDASVRLYRPVTDKVLYDLQVFPHRAEMHWSNYDGMYSYDSTYKWFGVTRAQMGKKGQVEGGKQFLRNCTFLYHKIYNELLECAKDHLCIEPPGHTMRCTELTPDKHPSAVTRPEDVPNRECFRYDQSALTIVLHKHFNLNASSRPVRSLRETLGVHRQYTTCYTLHLKETD